MSERSYTPDSKKPSDPNAAVVPEKKVTEKTDEQILSLARKRLDMAIAALSDTRENEIDDLKFAAGSSDNNWQWPTDVFNARTNTDGGLNARPMLTVNQLPQHIKQITNDQRQNRPGGQTIPMNDGASVEVSEMLDGLIRHVESISDADVVYDTASEAQVTYGEGYWRILTKYINKASFDQDIFLEPIENSFSVYLDPLAKGPCGEGSKWGTILEDMLREEFEEQFPNAEPISSIESWGKGDSSFDGWLTASTIRVAEYYYIDSTSDTIYLFGDGKTAFKDTPEYEVYQKEYGDPIKSRKTTREVVRYCKHNGYEILERNNWAGDEIPIIRATGNKFIVEGRVYYSGIVRNAKDPQRMYNYWTSQEAEMLALAPKAPFIGYAGQFEGYENDWKTANVKNHPYLQVNPDVTDGEGRVLPLPQRAQPPMVQSGLIAAKQAALEDIKNATGQYNASLGQTSNERSGKAILARQHEGDVSTYHYSSNFARAIRYSTRQIVKLIPKIYDTQRVARILGEDGSTKFAKFDPKQASSVVHVKDEQGNTIEKIFNPSVGEYDVMVVSGPGFATKRREALDAMAQLLQATPELWHIAGDLFVKNMDWPGAQELAKRFQKTIDPKLLDNEDPAFQKLKTNFEQLTQEYQQALGMLKNAHNALDAKEVDIKWFLAQVQWYSAQTDRMKVTEPGMNEQQVQDIATGTVHAALMPSQVPPLPAWLAQPPQAQAPQQPQQGAPAMPPAQMPQQPPQAPPGVPGGPQ